MAEMNPNPSFFMPPAPHFQPRAPTWKAPGTCPSTRHCTGQPAGDVEAQAARRGFPEHHASQRSPHLQKSGCSVKIPAPRANWPCACSRCQQRLRARLCSARWATAARPGLPGLHGTQGHGEHPCSRLRHSTRSQQ